MGEFKAINTQEEFDAAIRDRLERQEKKIRSEYADYEELKKGKAGNDETVAKLQKDLDDANGKIKAFELDNLRGKISKEIGLPDGVQGRLKGETEDEIRKDAEALKEIFKANNRSSLPGFEGEQTPSKDDPDAGLKKLLKGLKSDAD